MKMKYKDFSPKIRPNDVIEMITDYVNGENYLVLKIEKNCVKVLPLSQCKKDFEKSAIPYLSIPYDMIINVIKLDNSSILYYANSNNPHIVKVIRGM
jgi:hypothetical protein